jgi:lipid-A-disaccharide synthase
MRCPRRERAGNGPPAIGLFPGSRPSAYEHTLPFLIKVADEAARSLPGARWLIARSPYVIQEALVRAGAGAQWREGALVSERGTRLEICPPERVMSLADIAITPPGTSTAEMAALGLRMIVWFGTGHIAMHPLHGMAGHLERIPLFGPRLKRAAARRQYRRMQFHAHPNRAAGRCIVPEMVGDVTASAMVRALLEELEKPAEPIERELMAAMGPPGAAMRLVERVLRFPPERRTLAGN